MLFRNIYKVIILLLKCETKLRTYKYKIYPTKKQQDILSEWMNTCRILYNRLLRQRNNEFELKKYLLYQHNGILYKEKKEITKLKRQLNWCADDSRCTILDTEAFFIFSSKDNDLKEKQEIIDKLINENYKSKVMEKYVPEYFNKLNLQDIPLNIIDDCIKKYGKFSQYGYVAQMRNRNVEDIHYINKEREQFEKDFTLRLKQVPMIVLQEIMFRVHQTMLNFFEKRAGFAKYKKYGTNKVLNISNSCCSEERRKETGFLYTSNSPNVYIDNNKVIIPFMKEGIRINQHRDFPDGTVIKQCEIICIGDRWYANFSIDTLDKNTQFERIETDDKNEYIFVPSGVQLNKSKVVGIDVGILQLMVLSSQIEYHDINGILTTTDTIENPRMIREFALKVRKAQRDMSRKLEARKNNPNNPENKGQNLRKTIIKLQRAYDDLNNKKHNFLYYNIYQIVKQFDYIILENLDTSNLIKARKKKDGAKHKKGERARNRGFNKALLDCSFYKIKQIFIDQCTKQQKGLILISPAYTTQDCSKCSTRIKKSLSTRTHICPNCGLELDRDKNASLNIKKKGLYIIKNYL